MWFLILLSHVYYGDNVAVVPHGFETKAQCEAAGAQWAEPVSRWGTSDRKIVCISTNPSTKKD